MAQLIVKDFEMYKKSLYTDLKKVLGVVGNINEESELNTYIDKSLLKPYIGHYFNGTSNDSILLNSLSNENLKPFNTLISKLGYKSNEEFTDNVESQNAFLDLFSGYVGSSLFVELLKNKGTSESLNLLDKYKKNYNISSIDLVSTPFIDYNKEIPGLLNEFVVIDNNFETNIGAGVSCYTTFLKFRQFLNKPEYTEEVIQAVDGILSRMEFLYSNLWGKNFIALCLPDGKLAYTSSEVREKYNKLISRLNKTYIPDIINGWLNNQGNNVNLILKDEASNTNIDNIFFKVEDDFVFFNYNYIPYMHLKYLTSKDKWTSEYKVELKKKLLNILETYSKDEVYGDIVFKITNALTNALFILDVNKHTIQLRASNIKDFKAFEYNVTSSLKEHAAGAETISLISNELSNRPLRGKTSDIINITAIYSMSAFEQEVLFAHKLYKGPNAIKPSIFAPVLGVKLDGTFLQEDLFSGTTTTILAGSRSGKGTLTMSLLAPLLASGEPIIYIDNKPDIAGLFWDLERKYSNQGKDVKFLAIDTRKQISDFDTTNKGNRGIVHDAMGNVINMTNVPEFFNTVPKALDKETGFVNIFRTYKLLQLLFAMGTVFNDPRIEYKNRTMYVFIDEITDLNKRLETLYTYLDSALKIKASKGLEKPEELLYAEKLVSVMSDVVGALGTMTTMVNPSLPFKFVTIGQKLDKSWPSKSLKLPLIGDFQQNLVYDLLGKTENWLSGRVQLNKDHYDISETESKFITKTGIFLKHKHPPYAAIGRIAGITAFNSNDSEKIQGSIFRSYFALVQNDVDKNIDILKSFNSDDEFKSYFRQNEDKGYTNKFLWNRYKDYGHDDFLDSLNELYNESGIVKGVGFGGLIEEVASVLGKDIYSNEFIGGLNTGYNQVELFFNKLGFKEDFGYSCIEDYLFDCSINSLFTKNELITRFMDGYLNGVVSKKDTKKALNNTDDSDIFDDSDIGSEYDNLTNIEKPGNSSVSGVELESDSGAQIIENTNIKPINSSINSNVIKNLYNSSLKELEENNPYSNIVSNPNLENSTVHMYNAYNKITSILLNDIARVMGGLNMIREVYLMGEGQMVLNGLHYKPSLPENIELPYNVKLAINNGNLSDVFCFTDLKKFSNLQSLKIESISVARKVAQELGIPKNEDLGVLLGDKRYSRIFSELIEVVVGGVSIPQDSQMYEPQKRGWNLGEKLGNLFNRGSKRGYSKPNPMGDSKIGELYEKPWVKRHMKALGWTVGPWVLLNIAMPIVGPWALLYGGWVAMNHYGNYKRSNENVSMPAPRQSKSSTKGTKKNNVIQNEDEE